MNAMRVCVRWGWRARALFALAIPIFTALSLWAFYSKTNPSAVGGCVIALAAVGAIVVQVAAARYRLDADTSGLIERTLFGTRTFTWREIERVDSLAQRDEGGKIVRWSAPPEEAFHLTLHARRGRVSVNRWMTGIDDLIALLRQVGALPLGELASLPRE